MKRSIIKIKDLSFNFYDKIVFEDLTLDIYEGSFTTIIGKNGSGKTTFANLLAAIYKGEGYVNIDGYLLNNYFEYKIKRNISFCFDSSLPFDTARDALAFPLEGLQYSKKEINILINKTSQIFKLEKILDEPLDKISTSDRCKIKIAAALIHNPKIIVIDDLLRSLTNDDKKLITQILKNYKKDKKLTILLITSDLEDTLLSDRIIVFHKGQIVKDGSPSEVYKDDYLEKIGLELPFIVKLSHNLILYDLLDKVYFKVEEALDKLWP